MQEHLEVLENNAEQELEKMKKMRDEAGRNYKTLTSGLTAEQEFGKYLAYMDGVQAMDYILEQIRVTKKLI